MLSKLSALDEYRRIIVEIFADSFRKPFTAKLEQLTREIRTAMEPTLGPATNPYVGLIYCMDIRLEFHSSEHKSAILRAQVQKRILDADGLKQGG